MSWESQCQEETDHFFSSKPSWIQGFASQPEEASFSLHSGQSFLTWKETSMSVFPESRAFHLTWQWWCVGWWQRMLTLWGGCWAGVKLVSASSQSLCSSLLIVEVLIGEREWALGRENGYVPCWGAFLSCLCLHKDFVETVFHMVLREITLMENALCFGARLGLWCPLSQWGKLHSFSELLSPSEAWK